MFLVGVVCLEESLCLFEQNIIYSIVFFLRQFIHILLKFVIQNNSCIPRKEGLFWIKPEHADVSVWFSRNNENKMIMYIYYQILIIIFISPVSYCVCAVFSIYTSRQFLQPLQQFPKWPPAKRLGCRQRPTGPMFRTIGLQASCHRKLKLNFTKIGDNTQTLLARFAEKCQGFGTCLNACKWTFFRSVNAVFDKQNS